MNRLHPGYSVWWAVIIPGAFVAYLWGYPKAVGALLAIGAVVELVAVLRKKPGDTLSEHVWALLRDRLAMLPLALGLAVWLVWTPLTLLPAGSEIVESVGIDLGLWSVALGVLAWLLAHFGFRGRYG